MLFGDKRIVIDVEVDEDGGHPAIAVECEVSRMCTLTSVFQRETMFGAACSVVFLRLNPDACDAGPIHLEERVKVIATRINELMANPPAASPVPFVEYYYYHSNCHGHIDFTQQQKDAIVVNRVFPENLQK
jgi:hypothetical protein